MYRVQMEVQMEQYNCNGKIQITTAMYDQMYSV